MVRIQPYVASDAADLARVHNTSFPEDTVSAGDLDQRLRQVSRAGGWAWSVHEAGRPVGYGVVTLVPGLDGVTEMNGAIDPQFRGRGLGSRLLAHILASLPRPQVRQVSYATDQMNGPAARFLQSRGFEVEHVEWQMARRLDPDYPRPAPWPAGYEIRQHHQAAAIDRFFRLYETIFAGHPWYQPYSSHDEVAAELEKPSDLQFLHHDADAIGLAWLRWVDPATVEIEPFGLVPAYQGRGLGRQFLETILHQLAGQGSGWALIGAWQNNHPAVHLYQRVGFQHQATRTYLAIDL